MTRKHARELDEIAGHLHDAAYRLDAARIQAEMACRTRNEARVELEQLLLLLPSLRQELEKLGDNMQALAREHLHS